MNNKLSVRERVLETASVLFYEKGYNNTGINEIIEKAGVAKASLYANFRSKEVLCIAYLQRKDVHFRQSLNEFIQSVSSGPQRILAIFDFLTDFFHTDDFRGCWCLNTLSELPSDNQDIRKEILNQKKAFRSYLKRVVEENIETGNAQSLANRIYLLYEGAITESYLHNDLWPIKDAKQLVADILND